MTRRKSFCTKLYKDNDQKGKVAAIELMACLGYEHLATDKEMYKKGDLIFEKDGQQYLVEVEVKNVGWDKKKFKYDTLHFAFKPKTQSDIFLSFNGSVDACFMCSKDDLINDENIIYKSTFNRSTGQRTYDEPFYEIQVEDCDMCVKKRTKWTLQN